MADWRKIIVGDAFKLPSKNPRYYVDVALLVPTLMSTIGIAVAFEKWPASWDKREAALWIAVLAGCLALAKNRAVLVGGISLYILLRGAPLLPTHPDPTGYLLMGIACAGLLVAWRKLKGSNTEESDKPVAGTLGVIVVVAAFAAFLVLALFLRWKAVH